MNKFSIENAHKAFSHLKRSLAKASPVFKESEVEKTFSGKAKTFLKELFCKHEYVFGNLHSKNKTFLIAAKRCQKCGKVKKI